MFGILFAPPGAPITKKEIVPRLDDFNHRSGNSIDFFCGGWGYGADWPPGCGPSDEKEIVTTTDKYENKTEWVYSSKHFNDFRKEVKSEAKKWTYSGEVDLLLLNAYKEAENSIHLDFSMSVVLNISQLKTDKVIESAPQLFERIFSYAENSPKPANIIGFSDRSGLAIGRSWLVKLVTDYLPGNTGDLWKQGRHYAVYDLTA